MKNPAMSCPEQFRKASHLDACYAYLHASCPTERGECGRFFLLEKQTRLGILVFYVLQRPDAARRFHH
jgi:hypothetical protein